MDIQFITSMAVITPDPEQSRALYVSALGLPLQAAEGDDYLHSEDIEGAKHFGVSARSGAPSQTWMAVRSSAPAHPPCLSIFVFDVGVDPRDWARPGTAAITRRLLRAKPGDILLCHDGGGNRAQTYAALNRVLPELKSRGLTFVTL